MSAKTNNTKISLEDSSSLFKNCLEKKCLYLGRSSLCSSGTWALLYPTKTNLGYHLLI
ncbi:hypothetical protein HanPSC8_Chr03g0128331 [Helianthus annuus]|uniref:Uncharacterized protein n=1 Tax=Helianthus annuus TaxID=4232 RepID=A0A251VAA3_HELAN|nr:hypothetical protein HanPSC8_Chr03g0128331 [Helianthus annuus]